MGAKAIDLTGKTFGRWTVLKRAENRGNHVYWICKCECGSERPVTSDRLRRNISKSCGCWQKEKAKQLKTTHGKHSTPEYRVWIDIKTRCNNSNHKHYNHYGGRGIRVCERWMNNFENFLTDIGERPSPDHTIERINVNGDYEPYNCKWETWLGQSQNRRPRGQSDCNGVRWKKDNKKWVADIRVNGKRVYLGIFENKKDAINARKQAEKLYWKSS